MARSLVLVAGDTRRSGGVSESVIAAAGGSGYSGRTERVADEEGFIRTAVPARP